jgi:hypothetical protein
MNVMASVASRRPAPKQRTLPGVPRKLIVQPILREPVLHQQLADLLRREIGPEGRLSVEGVVWWSVDMAGYVGRVPGLRTARGCVAGIPDIDINWLGRSYRIELKAMDGKLSPAQAQLATALLSSGSQWAVVRSASELLQVLDHWEIPRAHRLHIL